MHADLPLSSPRTELLAFSSACMLNCLTTCLLTCLPPLQCLLRTTRRCLVPDSRGIRSESDGAPIGGPDNHASYSFALLLDVHSQQFPGRVLFVDAENPTLSSWARYINHASDKLTQCNVEPKVDALKALVWFEARRFTRLPLSTAHVP